MPEPYDSAQLDPRLLASIFHRLGDIFLSLAPLVEGYFPPTHGEVQAVFEQLTALTMSAIRNPNGTFEDSSFYIDVGADSLNHNIDSPTAEKVDEVMQERPTPSPEGEVNVEGALEKLATGRDASNKGET